ncbi:non-specific lipid-transfer protein-like protein At2g13820 [Dendrobium catenatum]|uniref:non-specific lipid-transfer protein-like protein At2g13820 n=1 Tax=Dendrobium catenatum TaxID=906689 RepID=UPI0010A05F71|nr:non-specific lipid-transfer protein-like protein At2g13820 [Dendrobium catenatum]
MGSNLFLPFLLLISLASPSWPPAIADNEEAADLPCVKELLACQPHLRMSKPPAMCCLPLLSAIQRGAACLCAVFYGEPILNALNLTQEEALILPRSCGGDVPDIGKCRGSGGGSGDWPTRSPSPPPTPRPTKASAPAKGKGSSPSSATLEIA